MLIVTRDVIELLEGVDPGPVESFGFGKTTPKTSLREDRLEECSCGLTALSRNREPFALVSRRAIGFGQVMLVSIDLDSKESSWNGLIVVPLCRS